MNNRIDNTAYVENIEIGNDTYIYKNCRVSDSIIGSYSYIGDNSVVKNSKFGDFVQIQRNSMLQYVEMGDYSYAGMQFTSMHSKIGKYSSISWNVTIGGGEHDYKRITTHSFLYNSQFGMVDSPMYDRFTEKCLIGNDVWIGSGAIVLRGVTVSDGAVIAAGSVVTKDVPPYSVVAGVPAKVIKYRCDNETIERLLKLKWWDFPHELIKENIELFNSDINSDTLDILETLKESIE